MNGLEKVVLWCCIILLMLSMGIYVDDALADEPWVMACTLSEYDCTSLTPPEVSRSSSRLLGAYTFGGPAIVRISRDLRWGSNHYRMVLAHEYTHYLQDVVGDDVLNTMTICEIEAEAWHVGNTYAKLLNSPRLVDTEWSELYDDC